MDILSSYDDSIILSHNQGGIFAAQLVQTYGCIFILMFTYIIEMGKR